MWEHPYGGKYTRRMSQGTYTVERQMDWPHHWLGYWTPMPVVADPDPDRQALGIAVRTAAEAKAQCMDHFWYGS